MGNPVLLSPTMHWIWDVILPSERGPTLVERFLMKGVNSSGMVSAITPIVIISRMTQ